MKPFDLEKAKAGAPLVTRDGKPVKFIAHVPEASGAHKVICLLGCSVFQFYENGVSFQYSESPSDLFLADPPKVKREMAVAIGKDVNGKYWSICGHSEQDVLNWHAAKNQRVVSVHVHTWEEDAS